MLPSLYALPFYDFNLRASHARILLPAALASVPFGFVLVRVRVEEAAARCRSLQQRRAILEKNDHHSGVVTAAIGACELSILSHIHQGLSHSRGQIARYSTGQVSSLPIGGCTLDCHCSANVYRFLW